MTADKADIDPAAKQEILQSLAAGRKIEAIRMCRETTGVDLKEAKEIVEQMQAELPEAPKPTGPGGCSGVLVLALLSIAAVAAATLL